MRAESSGESSTCRTRSGRSGSATMGPVFTRPAPCVSVRLRWDEPVEPQLAYRFRELREVDRLAYVAVGTEIVAIEEIVVFLRRREDHHGQALRPRVGTEGSQDFEAIHLRELEIEQDDLREHGRIAAFVGASAEEIVQRLGPIARDDDLVLDVALLERAKGQCLVVGVVLDEEDDLFTHGWSPGPRTKKNVAPRSTSPSAQMCPPCLRTMR